MLRLGSKLRHVQSAGRIGSNAALLSVVVALACWGALLGCDSSSSENWIVTVSPSTFTVAPGDSFEVEVRGEYTSGSSGNIDLYLVEPSPSGAPFDSAVAKFTHGCTPLESLPPSISVYSGVGFCTLFIHVGAGAQQGDYEVVVRGDFTSDGALDDSNSIFLTVALPPGAFSLSASGGNEIPDGGTLPLSVNLTRDAGFTGPVDLTVNNMPAGITGVFDPATIPSGITESTLTLANMGALPGDYQIQIVGTANNGSVATEDYAIMATKALSAGWHVVQEVSDVGQFRELDCPSSSVCYAVGDAVGGGPAAYKTSDGGQTWTSLSPGVSGEAHAVQFLDEMTGYIGGFDLASETNGYLLKTTNGGTSWTNVGANMPTNLAVRALHFFDANSGYAAGGANAPSDTTKVMYTADGGANWTALPWTGFSSHVVLRLYFWSINEGYVNVDTNSGQSPTYYTTDGGQNWILSTGFSGWFTDVSGGLGVAGTNTLFSASSLGANWSTEAIPGGTALGVTTLGNRTWVAGRSGGAFVAYKEGGVWTTDWNAAVGEADELYDIEMFSNTEGVAIGRNFMARRIPE